MQAVVGRAEGQADPREASTYQGPSSEEGELGGEGGVVGWGDEGSLERAVM